MTSNEVGSHYHSGNLYQAFMEILAERYEGPFLFWTHASKVTACREVLVADQTIALGS